MKDSRVFLVGAGCGDPELLTVKALRLLQEADVVVYDRLISKEIMDLIPEKTEKFYVGKNSDHKNCFSQEDIEEVLLKLVKDGYKKIVRFKGGDPFIFARGGEEALRMSKNNIEFEIVPGITTASGTSMALGIPLTHRGVATSVRFITGHRRDNKPLDLKWDTMIDPEMTLVVYMGLSTFPEISENLIKAGMPADTPVAAVENATRPEQRHILSDIKNIPQKLIEKDFKVPTLFIIGDVVNVAKEMGLSEYLEKNNVILSEAEGS